MRMRAIFALAQACGLALGLTLPAAQAEVFAARVSRVLDGDTVALDSGTHVRLLDIDTPEMARDGHPAQPGAQQARRALAALVEGRTITFQTARDPRDVYGRTLAHAFTPDGGWVNGTLVRDGLAHVYTFAGNALYAPELLAHEDAARAARRGLWAQSRWRVRDAQTCCAPEDIGQFMLVEGVVKSAAFVRGGKGGRTYLNFGDDWRRDFSVFVDKRDEKWFRAAGIRDIAAHYKGRRLRVRGFLQPVNGVLVRVTHPQQLEDVKA